MNRCHYSECGVEFEPRFRSTEECCSAEHAIAWVRETAPERLERKKQRALAAEKREARRELRKRKQEIKSRSAWLKEAQAVFNAWVRERDYGLPCVSCGGMEGPWDCGHYLGVGAYPELRFEPLNAARQCRFKCNRGGGYIRNEKLRQRVTAAFRVTLIERIGLRQVEWLESYHEPLKPSVEWLREKIREWRLETRRMRESREARAA